MRGEPQLNPGTGKKYQVETDYSGFGAFPLRFQRHYNSSDIVRSANLGPHWRSTFDRSIVTTSDPAVVTTNRPNGKAFDFRQTSGAWSTDADIVERLQQITGGWRYTNANDDVETYNASGKLVSIASPSGLQQTLAYDASGRLQLVTDPSGSSLTFAYDANGRLASLTDPAGGMYAYAYGTDGNLASVTYPGGGTRQYLYNESDYTSGANLPNALTGLLDENGGRFATWYYDSQGRAVSSEHGAGIDKASISYVGNENGSGMSSVTDALGNVRTINFQTILGVARSTGESQPGGSGCGPASSAITYDANGNVASRADFNGNQTCYAYDTARNLETARVEGLAAGKSCPTNIATYTRTNGTAERVITSAWHASFRLPVSITEPGRATSYTYDTQGNLTQKSVSDTVSSATRTWNWTYTYSSLVPSLGLADSLRELDLKMGRLKTGTPPRLDAKTIDFSKTAPQWGDDPPQPFSYSTE